MRALSALSALLLTLSLTPGCPAPPTAAPGEVPRSTLDIVRERGRLRVGVKDSQPGFGFLEPDGSYSGHDIEFARAIAAAVLGDADKVDFIPSSAANRFELLGSGEIDVLIRTTTWTASRDGDLGAAFVTTTFYDGQGVMVRSDSPALALEDLAEATICVTAGTTTEANLEERFRGAGLGFTPLAFENDAQARAAFAASRCDAWTGDRSNLAAQRSAWPPEEGGPDALRILSETFSKEPLGPAVRDGDSRWFDAVNWVVIGMIEADELGIGQNQVEAAIAAPANPRVARLLGLAPDGGAVADPGLGLPADFMQPVLRQVGHYGDVYERTVAPLGLPRAGTLNASWRAGGLLYAPPLR